MSESKAYPFLLQALQNCANQPRNENLSKTYRLIEAALSVMGCHPAARTLEEIAKSIFSEQVQQVSCRSEQAQCADATLRSVQSGRATAGIHPIIPDQLSPNDFGFGTLSALVDRVMDEAYAEKEDLGGYPDPADNPYSGVRL